MSEERKFCCGAEHEEHPDPRNYNWGKIGLGSTLKPYGKSESIPFKVLDQKRSNACGGFAAVYYKFAIEWFQIMNRKQFSPYSVYGNRDSFGYMGEGMYTRDVNNVMKNSGVPFYQPFDDSPNGYTVNEAITLYRKNKAQFEAQAKLFRNTTYYSVYTWTQVMQAIANTGGCLLMVAVYPNYYTDTYIDREIGSFCGYHFLCAIDYTDDFKYVKCINSWGNYNDAGGYLYINTEKINFVEASAWVDNYIEKELRAFEFDDVSSDRWSKDYIETVTRKHYMDGYEDNTFRPEAGVSRAEVAKILCLMTECDILDYSSFFTDVPETFEYARFISTAQSHNWISGYEDQTFRPYNIVTREEMATMLCRAFNLPDGANYSWSDVPKDRWSYKYVNACRGAGLMIGTGAREFSPETTLTREQVAKIICHAMKL